MSEAAAALEVSRSLVQKLVSRGELPAVRLGERRILIPRKAVEELLSRGDGVGHNGSSG